MHTNIMISIVTRVFAFKGIFIFANGSVRKVPRCNVQICTRENEEVEENG